MEIYGSSPSTIIDSYDSLMDYFKGQGYRNGIGFCGQAQNLSNYYGVIRFNLVTNEDSNGRLTYQHYVDLRYYGGDKWFVSSIGSYTNPYTSVDPGICRNFDNAFIKTEYSDFWFPFLSCVSFLFIVFMIYRIFIKRLLP